MPRRTMLRASDSDREHIAERLRHATAEGRLLAEELEERLAAALRARTYGELDALVADLPASRSAVSPRERSSVVHYLPRAVALAAAAVIAVTVVALAVLIVTGLLAVWMFWAAIAWWFFGRRRHGPGRRHLPPYGRGRYVRPGHGGYSRRYYGTWRA